MKRNLLSVRAAGLLIVMMSLWTIDAIHVAAQEKIDAALTFSPTDKVEGKTQAEWSAEWWKWALAPKKDRNPLLDKTGEFAGVGQSGPVWFLAGNIGGTTKRKCSVPAGKPILIPVFNYVAGQPSKAWSAEERKKLIDETTAEAKGFIDRGTDLEFTLNGAVLADLGKRRFVSPLFETKAPSFLEAIHPSFAGDQTGVSDGYWVMLKPLSAKEHTLRIRSKLKPKKDEEPFELDVTYVVQVEAKK